MPLQFDDAWLIPGHCDLAEDLRILGMAGPVPVQFRIPRDLALTQLRLPESQQARPGLLEWSQALQRACERAYGRVSDAPCSAEILVKAGDFPGISNAAD